MGVEVCGGHSQEQNKYFLKINKSNEVNNVLFGIAMTQGGAQASCCMGSPGNVSAPAKKGWAVCRTILPNEQACEGESGIPALV